MRDLANSINQQLCKLQNERNRFQEGDLELKNAITNISHDLRTPLTAICAYLNLLEQEEASEKARYYLIQIQNRTEVLKNLTEELFRYKQLVLLPLYSLVVTVLSTSAGLVLFKHKNLK